MLILKLFCSCRFTTSRYFLVFPDMKPLRVPSSFLFLISLLAYAVSSAGKNGPTATVSIESDLSYITGRECAVGCLWNEYHILGSPDLSYELSCGETAINGCYCKTDYASSATSYISNCVSTGCSDLQDVSGEVKTIVDLYNGYCETANARTTAAELPNAIESPSTDTLVLSTGARRTLLPTSSALLPAGKSNPSALASSNSSPTGRSGPSAAESTTEASPGSGGLGESDVIELGVGLGVGIPSLLLVLVGLWLQIKKWRQNPRTAKDERVEGRESVVNVL